MKKLVFSGVLMCAVALLAGCSIGEGNNIITRQQYEKIEEGMSYEEVKSIIGFDGQLSIESRAGRRDVDPWYANVFTFEDEEGTAVKLIFREDKLFEKQQEGLD